ncbi:MAG TPA: TauD/TfdA family dioxygenase [Trebonia sp.]|nr:TauD/TfdA family dioxygenase [Trebonia sp.]
MAAISTRPVGEHIGAEVLGVDVERLLADDDLPGAVMDALEAHSVLVFRGLDRIDDATQVAFGQRLGPLVRFRMFPAQPFVTVISHDPGNPNAQLYKSNDFWHLDGALDEIPAKASIMTGRVLAAEGGDTEFASTYLAYEELSDREKELAAQLRVVHTMEAIQLLSYPDPTTDQQALWDSRPARLHPLVWTHHSGRKSLVVGATVDHVEGLAYRRGITLIRELQERATAPGKVLRHVWKPGDLVIWDNRGLIHRAAELDKSQPRVMHRCTLLGDEPIR